METEREEGHWVGIQPGSLKYVLQKGAPKIVNLKIQKNVKKWQFELNSRLTEAQYIVL